MPSRPVSVAPEAKLFIVTTPAAGHALLGRQCLSLIEQPHPPPPISVHPLPNSIGAMQNMDYSGSNILMMGIFYEALQR